MMKVSYTINPERVEELSKYCDDVKLVSIYENGTDFFLNFVKENIENEIFVYSFEDIGMQLVQLLPAIKVLKEVGKIIYIEDRVLFQQLTHQQIFDLLCGLSAKELSIMRNRASERLKLAQLNGTRTGRPPLNQALISQIKELYTNEKKSIREIAAFCDVSVGTAYKYATNNEWGNHNV